MHTRLRGMTGTTVVTVRLVQGAAVRQSWVGRQPVAGLKAGSTSTGDGGTDGGGCIVGVGE